MRGLPALIQAMKNGRGLPLGRASSLPVYRRISHLQYRLDGESSPERFPNSYVDHARTPQMIKDYYTRESSLYWQLECN